VKDNNFGGTLQGAQNIKIVVLGHGEYREILHFMALSRLRRDKGK